MSGSRMLTFPVSQPIFVTVRGTRWPRLLPIRNAPRFLFRVSLFLCALVVGSRPVRNPHFHAPFGNRNAIRPGYSPVSSSGSVVCPQFACNAVAPICTRPSTAIPPPQPVPRITAKTTWCRARSVRGFGDGQAVGVVRATTSRLSAALKSFVERLAVHSTWSWRFDVVVMRR